ncbi:hypothetical protein S7335_5282 [Synechococcus sp. PCC 7335]|uniref:DciA family protein n=1 Tax=Synechococcus sp. (strain ATCC 29403 / PCC 7335) TaxID=91464 RepID=UPI00017EE7B9|nr:DUF721 domain-containing protein [Synechococcus sp. PCC 7335]EDX87572.1 hypothetical protein S7335_5282 [Synechococcus sp. PCC 7335]
MGLEGLNSLIKGLETQDSWQTQRQFRLVLAHWPKAVGFAVARQTKPVRICRAELYVATATPVWAQTLTYERFKILRKLNRYQSQPIKNIRFSTAQWTTPEAKSARSRLPNQTSLQHPSHTGQTTQPFDTKATTPMEAYERWAHLIQRMQQSQSLCPNCRCRCPQGELDRWSVCALCASKQWQ